MRFKIIFLIIVIFLGTWLSTDADAKTTKFQETLNCQPNTDCSSMFSIPKGAKATFTISVATSDRINFRVENPNGDIVRLTSSTFPDTQGMTQVFTRVMTADVAGDYTLYFLKPIPQNFKATVSVVIVDTEPVEIRDIPAATPPDFDGGCLIATATYGSELAPQVQQLRELRDNKLLQTESGSAFMESFNDFYYSFSPTIADYERENPVFREAVKVAITPMISSLSILNHADIDSEAEVLGYGISMILLNIGMYFGVPMAIVFGIRKKF